MGACSPSRGKRAQNANRPVGAARYNQGMSTPSTIAAPRPAGRWLLLLGILTAVLGVLAYVAQVLAHRLYTPWYLPISGTVATLLLFVALRRRAIVWRVVVWLPVALLAVGEWLTVAGTLPPYTGPVAVNQPFPAFATTLADGTPLTQADLRGKQGTVMVFFRGRW